jgi:hypothetical protein
MPYSLEELENDEYFVAADPATKLRALNANHQIALDEFEKAEKTEAFPQALDRLDSAYEQARVKVFQRGLQEDIASGALDQSSAQKFIKEGLGSFDEDGEAKSYLENRYGGEDERYPIAKQRLPLMTPSGNEVGEMTVRVRKDGKAHVAYRLDKERDEDVQTVQGPDGYTSRVKVDGEESKSAGDKFGSYVVDTISEKDALNIKRKEGYEKGKSSYYETDAALKEQDEAVGLTDRKDVTEEDVDKQLSVLGKKVLTNEEKQRFDAWNLPGAEGQINVARDKFVDHAKQNLAADIGDGFWVGLPEQAAKGFGKLGASTRGLLSMMFTDDSKEEIADLYSERTQLLNQALPGQTKLDFRGNFTDQVLKGVSEEAIPLAITMGSGAVAGGVRRLAVSGAEGMAEGALKSTLTGRLGKIIGTKEFESAVMKQVADRATLALASLPSSARSGMESFVSVMDEADTLRKEGKTEEADAKEEQAVGAAWGSIGIEAASENLWLNEMWSTRAGSPLGAVTTKVLTKQLGAEKLGQLASRMKTSMTDALKGAGQEGAEEVVAGIAGRAWMNEFTEKNQDLLEGVGVEFVTGAVMGAAMSGAKALAKDGRPEVLRELRTRGLTGDAEAFIASDNYLAKAESNSTNAKVIDKAGLTEQAARKVVQPQDVAPYNDEADVITFIDTTGQEQQIKNENKVFQREDGKWMVDDVKFQDEFDSKDEAQNWAQTRHQTRFEENLRAQHREQGVDSKDSRHIVGIVNSMFQKVASAAGVRPDAVYMRMENAPIEDVPAVPILDPATEEPVIEKLPDPAVGVEIDQTSAQQEVAEAAPDTAPPSAPTELNQTEQEGPTPGTPLGRITLVDNGAKAILKSFKGSNASTALHETFHGLQLLKIKDQSMIDLALGGQAETFWNWATDNGRVARDNDEALEKGARGFEAYLFEGKSPTPFLRKAFAAIAKLFKSIYGDIRALGIHITPEIRRAYDALFRMENEGMPEIQTTDAEILGVEEVEESRNNRYAEAKGRVLNQNKVLYQGGSEQPEKRRAADLLEIASFHIENLSGQGELSFQNFFQRIRADIPTLAAAQVQWLWDRSAVLTELQESEARQTQMGQVFASMIQALEASQPEVEFIDTLKEAALDIIQEEGREQGNQKQAEAISYAIINSKTTAAIATSMRRAADWIVKANVKKFRTSTDKLRTQMAAFDKGRADFRGIYNELTALIRDYTNGPVAGMKTVTRTNKDGESVQVEVPYRDYSKRRKIDADLQSAMTRLLGIVDDLSSGKKHLEPRELLPQINALMARMERSTQRRAEEMMRKFNQGMRRGARDKNRVIQHVKDMIRKSGAVLNRQEVRGVLSFLKQNNSLEDLIANGHKLRLVIENATIRGEIRRAEGLHKRASEKLGKGIYGDGTEQVVAPFLAVEPSSVPLKFLPVYIAHLEMLNSGGSAVAFADYSASLGSTLTGIYAAQAASQLPAGDIAELNEAAGAPGIVSDAKKQEALEIAVTMLEAFNPAKLNAEVRPWANQVAWLKENPESLGDWSVRDLKALAASLHNASFGVADVFFGKIAGRAFFESILPHYQQIFDIAIRKELGIKMSDIISEDSLQNIRDREKSFLNTIANSTWSLFNEFRIQDFGKRLSGVGQHMTDDAMGTGEMVATWLNAPLYKAAQDTAEQASTLRDMIHKAYMNFEAKDALQASVEEAAIAAGSFRQPRFTGSHIARQQFAGRMTMAYLLQREWESNGNEGNWVEQEMAVLRGLPNRAATRVEEQERTLKLADGKVLSQLTRGDMSAEKLEKLLSTKQKDFIKDYDFVKKVLGPKVFYTSLLSRGQYLPMLNNHVHHSDMMSRTDLEDMKAYFSQMMGQSGPLREATAKGSTPARPGSSYERSDKGVKAVSWDIYGVVMKEIEGVLFDYNITPFMSAVGKSLKTIENAVPNEAGKQLVRAFAEMQAGHLAVMASHQVTDNRLPTSVIAYMKGLMSSRAIASITRAAQEFLANASRFMIAETGPLAAGTATYYRNQKAWMDLFAQVGLTVLRRGDTYSIEAQEASIERATGKDFKDWLAGLGPRLKRGQGTLAKHPTEPGLGGFFSTNKLQQEMRSWGRFANSFGDSALARPLAAGKFMQFYKDLSGGQEFDIQAVTQMNPEAMKGAAVKTERFINQNLSPSNSDMNPLKIQSGVRDSASAWGRTFLYALVSFNRTIQLNHMIELGKLVKAPFASRNKWNALRSLAAMTMSSTIYGVLGNLIAKSIRAAAGDDEDENNLYSYLDELTEVGFWGRQMTGGFLGNLIGGQGFIFRTLISMGMESGWALGRSKLYGSYDRYRDNLTQTIPIQSIVSKEATFDDAIRLTTGLFGTVVNDAISMSRDAVEASDPNNASKERLWALADMGQMLTQALLQYPSSRDLDRAIDAKMKSERSEEKKARKNQPKYESETKAAANAFIRGGSGEKWSRFMERLPTDKLRENANKTLQRERALAEVKVGDPDDWRKLANINDSKGKAEFYLRMYNDAPDKEAFKAQRAILKKRDWDVWSRGSTGFRKELRARGYSGN